MRKMIPAFFCLFLALQSYAAPADEEKRLADSMVSQLVRLVEIALEDMDPSQPGVAYARMPNEHNQTPCYPMAWLYANEHPLNPYHGDRKMFDTAVAICDHTARNRGTLEWPLYTLCQVYELLEDELDPQRKKAWKDYAAYYVSVRANRPFFYTSWNHEGWSSLAIYRAGQVFDEPQWREFGLRMMHQLLKVQEDLGYFDEGPHHGPSMKYSQVQVHAMLLFADYSGDRQVLEASRKLADFLIRYSFPDGTPIGTFDGRQSWSLGYGGMLLYGFDRWPLGKTINRRLFRTRERRGVLDPDFEHYSISDWYEYFGMAFKMDEYLSLRPDAPASSLPQDADGYLMVEEGESFDGGTARNHGWMVAISAIDSDIPRLGASQYRLERQSRLDVWHNRAGLIIGGGHNLRELDVPLANFHVVTGYAGVDVEWGELTGDASWYDKRSAYIPRDTRDDITVGRQKLTASFAQGDVGFTVVPLDSSRLKIGFEYDLFNTRKLFVQLPLISFYDGTIIADGKLFDGESVTEVGEYIELESPVMGTRVRVNIPDGLPAAIRPGVYPLRWYSSEERPDQRWSPYYKIYLLSVRIDQPAAAGGGEFMLEVSPL